MVIMYVPLILAIQVELLPRIRRDFQSDLIIIRTPELGARHATRYPTSNLCEGVWSLTLIPSDECMAS